MKTFASSLVWSLTWSGRLFVAAAAAFAGSGCTITVNPGGPDVTGDDDAAGQAETSTQEDAGSGADAGGDGGSCALAVETGSDACNACVESSCCDALIACDSEPADDGGPLTDCEEIDSCYGDCISPPPDSGVAPGAPTECTSLCSMTHSAQGQSDFQALQTCLTTNCANECN